MFLLMPFNISGTIVQVFGRGVVGWIGLPSNAGPAMVDGECGICLHRFV